MKSVKQLLKLLTLTVILSSFSQCTSAQKLEKNAPVTFGNVYCKKQVSGIANGPSGLIIFIEIKDNSIQLDSVYFREKGVELKTHPKNRSLYVGSFVTHSVRSQDIVLSSDSKAEYGNKIPKKSKKIPFELAYNECVVSYKINEKIKYYKITNVEEIHSIDIPMAPVPNNN